MRNLQTTMGAALAVLLIRSMASAATPAPSSVGFDAPGTLSPLAAAAQLEAPAVGPSIAAAAEERPGVEGSRRAVDDSEFGWVGRLTDYGNIQCSVFIVKHGLAVTARHCFTHTGFPDQKSADAHKDSLYMMFGPLNANVWVMNSDMRRVQFDSGPNDIAFIIYNEAATKSKISLAARISTGPIPPNTALKLIGFPDGGSYSYRERVVSEGCRTTGYQGAFPPRDTDTGYSGIFEDTTCAGWSGISGGPVFGVDRDGAAVLYGVITHTFDVLADGSINPKFIKTDEFGPHSTTMFSPLRDSRDLQTLMNAADSK